MKKITFAIVLFLTIILSLLVTNKIEATLGGPSYIHTFTYNPSDESVYYIRSDFGGRGCPPELMKLSLNTGKSETVYSCDKGIELLQKNDNNVSLVNSEINKIIANFKPLTKINLNNNKIAIDIDFLNSEKFPAEYGFEDDAIKNTNFTATIYQNNTKVTDLSISGCNKEQPFTFAGYAIPGFEKKIILLLSAVGNCWEGGYVYESLYMLGGVNNLDKTLYSNSPKGSSALIPDVGTLVVFEQEEINKTSDEFQEPNIIDNNSNINKPIENGTNIYNKKNISIVTFVISICLSVVLGVFLGRLFSKNS